jgi:hypothetical protein
VKTCKHCGETKPLEQMRSFWNKKYEKRYYQSTCRDCDREIKRSPGVRARAVARKKERYSTDPEFRQRYLDTQRKWRYGVTREQFDALLAAQGGGCAVCATTEPGGNGWHVDHDHQCCGTLNVAIRRRSCGKCTRGVLCGACNLAMGRLRDRPDLLLKMHDYITSGRSVPA